MPDKSTNDGFCHFRRFFPHVACGSRRYQTSTGRWTTRPVCDLHASAVAVVPVSRIIVYPGKARTPMKVMNSSSSEFFSSGYVLRSYLLPSPGWVLLGLRAMRHGSPMRRRLVHDSHQLACTLEGSIDPKRGVVPSRCYGRLAALAASRPGAPPHGRTAPAQLQLSDCLSSGLTARRPSRRARPAEREGNGRCPKRHGGRRWQLLSIT